MEAAKFTYYTRPSTFANFKTAKKINPSVHVCCGSADSVQVEKDKGIKLHGKEALRPGSWSTAAPVPRFQTLAPDWSTGSDMSRLPLSS
ncbi:hypothetical protein T11_1425 [Trichinella zimbabwensis]|uniref:Uncharacterized protein n=1 Tax=Trichinella zimbabwensis TaxID=268475 RepID=A0A0V1GKM5_9BILA|nr:hypothetical protein T11_1425 [Trichinella zimbabwensis]